jgi:hypothetical protein
VFLNVVKVDLAHLFSCPFFLVLDARGTDGYVGWENSL